MEYPYNFTCIHNIPATLKRARAVSLAPTIFLATQVYLPSSLCRTSEMTKSPEPTNRCRLLSKMKKNQYGVTFIALCTITQCTGKVKTQQLMK